LFQEIEGPGWLHGDEAMFLAELHQDLAAADQNASLGEIMCNLVDDVIGLSTHQAGDHDPQGVNGTALLRQPKLRSGPETDQHIAASGQAVLYIVLESRGVSSMDFRATA
jgi:hypothetical protein